MTQPVTAVQYWAGCPRSPNSKWRRFLALVQRCHEERWRNYLVLAGMPEDAALVAPFAQAGCRIVIQPRSRGNFDPVSIARTYRLLRRLKCDVFHCHNDHTSPLIGAVLARVPVRVWSKLSMSSFYEAGTLPRGLQRLHASNRVSSWCSHRVLALTETVRQEFSAQGGSYRKTRIVPAPVAVEQFAGAAAEGVREALHLTDSDFVITTVGHAVPVKGWDILLRAFARLSVSRHHLHLILVGSTSSEDERTFVEYLRSIVAQERIDRVHFLGQRSDIAAILKASDLFVFPSRSDGQGLALMEAMASGLPCLAAATGGIPDIIAGDVNGLLFEKGSVTDLAEKLSRLIEDDALRLRLAAGAREAAQRYAMDKYVQTVFECYRSLLGEKDGEYCACSLAQE